MMPLRILFRILFSEIEFSLLINFVQIEIFRLVDRVFSFVRVFPTEGVRIFVLDSP